MWSESKTPKASRQWGISSAGRAPALHAGGQEFESPILHHLKSRAVRLFFSINDIRSMYMFRQPDFSNLRFNIIVIRHLKCKVNRRMRMGEIGRRLALCLA